MTTEEGNNQIKINLRIGAMSPKLSEQIKIMGLLFDKDAIKYMDECCTMILKLKFSDILSDNEANKARDRIAKKVIAHLKKKNKLKQQGVAVKRKY